MIKFPVGTQVKLKRAIKFDSPRGIVGEIDITHDGSRRYVVRWDGRPRPFPYREEMLDFVEDLIERLADD